MKHDYLLELSPLPVVIKNSLVTLSLCTSLIEFIKKAFLYTLSAPLYCYVLKKIETRL